jgi:putative flippase GtrA
LSPTIANLISASAGLITNFILQKKYVFNPSNTIWKSFVLSVVFSICGLGLGTGLIYLLTNYSALQQFPVIAKICTTGVIFFYNYFTKKIAFGHSETGISSSC